MDQEERLDKLMKELEEQLAEIGIELVPRPTSLEEFWKSLEEYRLALIECAHDEYRKIVEGEWE